MQIQKVQSNQTKFGQLLVISNKIKNRATDVQKEELKLLQQRFKNNGLSGKLKVNLKKAYSITLTESNTRTNYRKTENINNAMMTRISIDDIIKSLRYKYSEIKKRNAVDKTIYDAFGDGYIL